MFPATDQPENEAPVDGNATTATAARTGPKFQHPGTTVATTDAKPAA